MSNGTCFTDNYCRASYELYTVLYHHSLCNNHIVEQHNLQTYCTTRHMSCIQPQHMQTVRLITIPSFVIRYPSPPANTLVPYRYSRSLGKTVPPRSNAV
ncbi:MFS transporter prlL [Fusarium oxysporum f. sp. albedinis]|nr:MFS transporter prlL [Fusarium oxysporum f. sp. albedinis]